MTFFEEKNFSYYNPSNLKQKSLNFAEWFFWRVEDKLQIKRGGFTLAKNKLSMWQFLCTAQFRVTETECCRTKVGELSHWEFVLWQSETTAIKHIYFCKCPRIDLLSQKYICVTLSLESSMSAQCKISTTTSFLQCRKNICGTYNDILYCMES